MVQNTIFNCRWQWRWLEPQRLKFWLLRWICFCHI